MTTETTPGSEKPNCQRHGRRGGFRRWLGFGAIFAAFVALPIIAFAGGPGRFMHGGCHGGDEPKSAAEVRERIGFMEARMLDRVDATPEQRETIGAILDEAATRVFERKQRAGTLHGDLKAALLADTIDRAELEEIRFQATSQVDDASRVGLDTIADIAEVLTVKQRRQIADDLAHFAPRH
jgi:Spy/CpxP family protein refolding chaperone